MSLDEIRQRDAAHWPWHDAPQQTVTGSVAIHDRRELLAMIDGLAADLAVERKRVAAGLAYARNWHTVAPLGHAGRSLRASTTAIIKSLTGALDGPT